MAFLEVIAGQNPGTQIKLDESRQVMGRARECELPLEVAAVSRKHAAFYVDGGRYFVEDLGSRNGTHVNGLRLKGPAPLHDGDEVRVCDQTFAFRADGVVPPSGITEAVDDPPSETSSVISRGLLGLSPSGSSRAGLEMTDDPNSKGSVMATLDLGGGSASWNLSAKPEVKLAALIEISNNLGAALTVEEVLPKFLESLFKIFVQADRGFVIMRPQPDAPLVPVASLTRRESDEEKTRISRTIVEEAMKLRKAILSADAASDDRFSMAQSIADFKIRSMICAPMIGSDGEAIGVVQIDTLNQKSRFTEEDLEVLAGVASQAAVAIDNARMHEEAVSQRAVQRDLELAQRMQLALLPSEPPVVEGYHFFDYYEAARKVGGDYYDYVSLPDGRLAVVLGDVAGKGVSAALIMARLSSDVRFGLAIEPDAAVAMTKINASFASHDWQDKFVTMIVAIIDPSKHDLTIVSAGHMPPMLRRAAGGVEEIGEEQSGLPLGVVEDFEYESFSTKLEPGDFVTLYTDGFSEAMNQQRDLYTVERLIEQVGLTSIPTKELGPHILNDVHQFVAGCAQSDDMCLACFGRLAS